MKKEHNFDFSRLYHQKGIKPNAAFVKDLEQQLVLLEKNAKRSSFGLKMPLMTLGAIAIVCVLIFNAIQSVEKEQIGPAVEHPPVEESPVQPVLPEDESPAFDLEAFTLQYPNMKVIYQEVLELTDSVEFASSILKYLFGIEQKDIGIISEVSPMDQAMIESAVSKYQGVNFATFEFVDYYPKNRTPSIDSPFILRYKQNGEYAVTQFVLPESIFLEEDNSTWMSVNDRVFPATTNWREIKFEESDGLFQMESFYGSTVEEVLILNEKVQTSVSSLEEVTTEVVYEAFPYLSMVQKQKDEIVAVFLWDVEQQIPLTLQNVVFLDDALDDHLQSHYGIKLDAVLKNSLYLDRFGQVRFLQDSDAIPIPHVYLNEQFLQYIFSH